MGEAAFWGFVGASSLIVAAEFAFAFKLSRMVIGLIMAFGVGALILSVSFELVAPAMDVADTWKVAVGLALGSAVFFLGDRAIANMGGSNRKSPDGSDGGVSGLGIVLGTVLDGIPESTVLGMSLVGGGGASVALCRYLGLELPGVARLDGGPHQGRLAEEQDPLVVAGNRACVGLVCSDRIRHRQQRLGVVGRFC